jgi:F-type H+-transporting ATPase subunit b
MARRHRLALAFTFALSLAFTLSFSSTSSTAFAQEHEAAGEERHGEEPVIVNWWSWDYGPNAKDPTHKNWPAPFGYAVLNFVLFAGILFKLAAKPLKSFVVDRHDRIAHDLDEAARLRQQAEAQLREYEKKVQNVDAEVDQLLAQIRQEAENEKLRIISAAEDQARKLKADAQRQIEAEIARARQELHRTVVEAAVAAAEGLVKQNIGSDDQHKMAEKYVTELEQTAPKPPRPVKGAS